MRKTISIVGRAPILIGFALIALITSSARAGGRWQGGLNLMVAAPQGTFAHHLEDYGGGINLDLSFKPPAWPFGIGLTFDYIIYGDESRREPLSRTIPDLTVDVSTRNNIVRGGFFMRLQPGKGQWRPYVDGVIGFNYLYTRTSLDDIYTSEGDQVNFGSTNFDDWAFTYGVRSGMMLRVYDGPSHNKKNTWFMDFRVAYLPGGEADYLKEGSILRGGGNVAYLAERSHTDLLSFHLGVTVEAF
jgi:hypothetical protein